MGEAIGKRASCTLMQASKIQHMLSSGFHGTYVPLPMLGYSLGPRLSFRKPRSWPLHRVFSRRAGIRAFSCWCLQPLLLLLLLTCKVLVRRMSPSIPCIFIYYCVCMHVCMYVCMYICVQVYMCVMNTKTCVEVRWQLAELSQFSLLCKSGIGHIISFDGQLPAEPSCWPWTIYIKQVVLVIIFPSVI